MEKNHEIGGVWNIHPCPLYMMLPGSFTYDPALFGPLKTVEAFHNVVQHRCCVEDLLINIITETECRMSGLDLSEFIHPQKQHRARKL